MAIKNKKNLIFILISVLVLINFNFVAAGETLKLNLEPSLNINPSDTFNSIGIKFNFPFDSRKLNIDTNIPITPVNTSQDTLPKINLKQFLTPKDISSDDLGGAIKAVITLVIEVFLVVISVTSQILRLILEFLR